MSQQLKSCPALVEEMIQYSIIPTPIKKPPVKTNVKHTLGTRTYIYADTWESEFLMVTV